MYPMGTAPYTQLEPRLEPRYFPISLEKQNLRFQVKQIQIRRTTNRAGTKHRLFTEEWERVLATFTVVQAPTHATFLFTQVPKN